MSYEQDQRMLQKQAELISKLNNNNKYLIEKNQLLAGLAEHGIFYRELMEAIRSHEAVQEEWDRFVMMLKLAVPDLEERMDEVKKEMDRKVREIVGYGYQ